MAKSKSTTPQTIAIGYFADGPWAHRALEKILADRSIRVDFICARYDRVDSVLREMAAVNRIACYSNSNINSDDFLLSVKPFGCDLFVSMSFNQIFKKRLIDLPRMGTINCHAGMLPFYRGRNVLNWALINDESNFGITVHYVDEGVDTGDILTQEVFSITDQDNYASLLDRAYDGCAELLYSTIKQLQRGQVTRRRQSEIHPLGFYCTARVDGDERLDWNQSSRSIFNFVRAICRPGPEARTYCGDSEIRINRVELICNAPTYIGIPGAVIGVEREAFLVKTLDSYVRVVEWSGAKKPQIGERLK
jgi:methionyl-tRNA formyltransferase